jgi:Protein of unknown function (DUF5818)
MRIASFVTLALLALAGGCATTPAAPPPPDPRPGDAVHIRGRLDQDVDCRLLRTEDGKVYSLSERLPNWRDGSRICVYGTIAQASQCMHTPSIEVEQVRPWSACR